MKIISPKLHGFLDSITTIFLFISPLAFDMNGVLAAVVYLLAVLQFMLTILTNYEYGVFRVIPFVLHGWAEIFIGCCLIVTGLFFRHALNQQGFYYCTLLAIVYILVPSLTRCRTVKYERNINSIL